MNELSHMIAGTPYWVWGVLVLVVFLGIKGLKPSSASLGRLVILPAVFLAWGLQLVLTKYALTPVSIGAWVAALAVGGAIGIALTAMLDIRADRAASVLHLPGSPVTLIVSLLIFVGKYAFAYAMARWPALSRDAGFIALTLASSGLFTGILVGRFVAILKVYYADAPGAQST